MKLLIHRFKGHTLRVVHMAVSVTSSFNHQLLSNFRKKYIFTETEIVSYLVQIFNFSPFPLSSILMFDLDNIKQNGSYHFWDNLEP